MTREDLLAELRRLAGESRYDAERAHGLADDALLEYVNDAEVAVAYGAIERWCA